jgi:putative sterol carrier protein
MAIPKCFVSYSWDSSEHRDWVLALGQALQTGGVYVYLDRWDVRPGMDLPKYMETSIRESDFVLLVCTPTFAQKADGGLGGVGYEKSIVTGEIFNSVAAGTKFVPILRTGSSANALPSYLRSRVYLDFTKDEDYQRHLEELLRHLHNEHAEVRPPVGAKPSFGASDSFKEIEIAQLSSSLKRSAVSVKRLEDSEYAKTLSRHGRPSEGTPDKSESDHLAKFALREITAKMREGAAKKSAFGNTVKFSTDQGVIFIDGNKHPPVITNDDRPADCTIRMDLNDFAGLLGGTLDGMTAFMTGKMKIEGDMGVAMKLQNILR